MSLKEEIEDELLGRWMDGDLVGEDLKAFEASDAFFTYKAIAQYADQIESPDYNVTDEFSKLKSGLDSRVSKGKVRKLNFIKKFSVAASIAILFGVGFFMLNRSSDNNVIVSTIKNETKKITLPGQSEVFLNIASNIEYNEEKWGDQRYLKLEGEAYFKVNKGNSFIVNTAHGSVKVLGTEFNIRSRNNLTEVICYESKVKVTDQYGQSKILTAGDGARLNNGKLETNWRPEIGKDAEWKNGYSAFNEVKLETVIEELENQFSITIQCNSNINERYYVGTFPHDNLEQAVKIVFEPMQLNYNFKSDTFVVVD